MTQKPLHPSDEEALNSTLPHVSAPRTHVYEASIVNGGSNVNESSADEQQLARLDKRSRFYPIEVHTAGKSAPIELDLVIPCLLFPILK
jgi:hypothetical protein